MILSLRYFVLYIVVFQEEEDIPTSTDVENDGDSKERQNR
jgi:hypothetical protein